MSEKTPNKEGAEAPAEYYSHLEATVPETRPGEGPAPDPGDLPYGKDDRERRNAPVPRQRHTPGLDFSAVDLLGKYR